MSTIRMAVGLLLGAAVAAACTDRSTPTASSTTPVSLSVSGGSTETSVVLDSVGDATWNKPPAWQDIVRASITRKNGRFTFEAQLAAPIPTDPALDPATPQGVDHMLVPGYGIDADPNTAPVGFPFNKNEANLAEFYLAVAWNPTGSFGQGTGFIAFLLDRRPLLTGGQATLTALPFSIQGDRTSLVVDAAALGDPTTFAWAAFTEQALHFHPPDNFCCIDFAPDFNLGAGLAKWPQ